jgi:hypothetical protein
MKRSHILSLARPCLVLSAVAISTTPALAQEVQQGAAGSVPATQEPSSAEGSPGSTDADAGQPDIVSRPPREDTPAPQITRSKPGDSRYRIELGVMPRYISNYFQAEDQFNTGSTPEVSTYVTVLSGSVAYDVIHEKDSTLTIGGRVRQNIFADIDGADSTELDATANYRKGSNEFRVGYYHNPKRLAGIVSNQNVYAETNRVNLEYLRRISSRWRSGVGYQFSRETYSSDNTRDVSRHQFHADIRYKVTSYFSPGVGIEYEERSGELENNSYSQITPMVMVTSSISNVAYLSFRYRHILRDYSTDIPSDSNFGRDDTRHELSFYGTVQLGHGLSIFGFAYHNNSDSSRTGSSFKSSDVGLGLFYRFP